MFTVARVAWACLTTFVSASATMKYAVVSIWAMETRDGDVDVDGECEVGDE